MVKNNIDIINIDKIKILVIIFTEKYGDKCLFFVIKKLISLKGGYMKKILLVVFFVFVLTSILMSEENIFMIGYERYWFPRIDIVHDTHPDDWFLPNASVPGSAGTTSLGGESSYLALGVRYEVIKVLPYTINLKGAILIGDITNSMQKNANDPRPDQIAAFVYSNNHYGFYLETGCSYYLFDIIGIGANVRFTGIYSEWGWSRFSSNQAVGSKWDWDTSFGPNLIVKICNKLKIEIGLQLKDGRPLNANIIFCE